MIMKVFRILIMLKKVSGRATKGIVRVRVRVRRVRMMSATRGRVKTRRVKTRRVKREKVKRRRVRVRMGRSTRKRMKMKT